MCVGVGVSVVRWLERVVGECGVVCDVGRGDGSWFGLLHICGMIGCSMFVHDAEIDPDPGERSAFGGCNGIVIDLTITECR